MKSEPTAPVISPRNERRARPQKLNHYKRTSFALVLLVMAAVVFATGFGRHVGSQAQPATLAQLLELSPIRLSEVSIAQADLLCASGLRPADEPDLKQCMTTLATWASRVRSETERHRYLTALESALGRPAAKTMPPLNTTGQAVRN